MAQANGQENAVRPRNPMTVCNDACRADDVSLMEQAIALASIPDSRYKVQDVIQRGLRRSAARNAIHVLQYVLDHGADISLLNPSSIFANDEDVKPSREMLEVLVTNGWDINGRGINDDDGPLLWYVVEYHDLVHWCLENGARVDVPDKPPTIHADGTQSRSRRPRPTILGAAAESGCIESFELLRARGAPLDARTLHLAVKQATVNAPKLGSPSIYFDRRMDMVRHLVDVVKLDVNAVEAQAGTHNSTALAYPALRPTKQDFSQLVWFLLDRGADPERVGTTAGGHTWPSAMSYARSLGYEPFLRLVQEWQAKKQSEDTH